MDPVAPVVPAAPAAAAPTQTAATPTPTTGTDILRSMTAAQRDDYQRTGELPTEIKPTFAEDSSPSKPAEQAVETATTDQTPPSEAATKKGAETRKLELQAEIDGLLKKRADLRRELAPPPTPPAAPSPAAEIGPKPDGTDYTKYPLGTADPGYIEDLAGWKAQSLLADRDKSSHEASEKARHEAATREAALDLSERHTAITAKYADFDEVVKGVTGIAPKSMLDAWILSSKRFGFEALYHLGKHPAEMTRVLAMTDPIEQIETMILLGHSLVDGSTPPAPKTKTDAPPPAPRLDTRATSAADDADAALARGDFAGYTRIMNSREIQPARK